MSESKREFPEIRVRGIGKKTHADLENIAANSGTTLSGLLKPKLIEIADSYPEHMKLPPKED